MKEFLTERNGVICRYCHATIDVTGRKMKDPPKVIRVLRKYLGEPEFFSVKCDRCNEISRHAHADIKPIVDWIQKEQEYQDTITELKGKLDETKTDATKMARKIISDAEPKIQESDLKSTSDPNKTKSTIYK